MDMLEKLSLAGLVPVIALKDPLDAVPLCSALSEGGLPVAEITFRTAAAEESIRRVHEALPNVLLCAGTVLSVEQARRAADAGAAVIVSPGLNPEVVCYCQERGIPVCPGTATPSDVEKALALGLKAVKFFPAEQAGGLKMIKALCGPYNNMMFMPTGGINENNLLDYLAFDKVLCCGGSWMVPRDAVEKKDWARITAITRSAVDKMLGLELRHVGINAGSGEEALKAAGMLSMFMGCEFRDVGAAAFVGDAFEILKGKGRGTHGHIAIAANSVKRAKWHLENRGCTFQEDSAVFSDGKMIAVYLKDEIAGFAIHLLQK